MLKHEHAVARDVLDVLGELRPRRVVEQRFEHALAINQWCKAQIEAIEIQQIEGVVDETAFARSFGLGTLWLPLLTKAQREPMRAVPTPAELANLGHRASHR
jgi:hypothetical protein